MIRYVAIALLLSGCAMQTMQQRAAQASDSALCFNARLNPNYEAQRAAEAEMGRRGATCTPEIASAYAAQRDAAIRAQQVDNANFNAAAQTIIQSRQQPPAPPIQPEIRCQSSTSNGQTYTVCR